MSTTTWNDINDANENSSFPNPVKIIVPIVIFCALILGIILYFMSQQTVKIVSENIILSDYRDLTPSEIRIIEIHGGHAFDKHGRNASKALDCLGRKGSTKSFKTTGFQDVKTNKSVPTNLWLCLDDDGSWYTVVTTISDRVFSESGFVS